MSVWKVTVCKLQEKASSRERTETSDDENIMTSRLSGTAAKAVPDQASGQEEVVEPTHPPQQPTIVQILASTSKPTKVDSMIVMKKELQTMNRRKNQ